MVPRFRREFSTLSSIRPALGHELEPNGAFDRALRSELRVEDSRRGLMAEGRPKGSAASRELAFILLCAIELRSFRTPLKLMRLGGNGVF